MAIEVKFFASLREQLGRDRVEVAYTDGITVADIWQQVAANEPVTGDVLAAVNMEYVRLETEVSDGDEVAFFPPVTGG